MSTVYIDMCICSKFTCENTSFICAQFVDVTNIKMHHIFYNLKACILYTYSVNALGIYKYRIVYIASRQRGIEKKKGAHTDTWESLPLTNVSACDWKSRTSACIPNSGTFVRACGEMKAPEMRKVWKQRKTTGHSTVSQTHWISLQRLPTKLLMTTYVTTLDWLSFKSPYYSLISL